MTLPSCQRKPWSPRPYHTEVGRNESESRELFLTVKDDALINMDSFFLLAHHAKLLIAGLATEGERKARNFERKNNGNGCRRRQEKN